MAAPPLPEPVEAWTSPLEMLTLAAPEEFLPPPMAAPPSRPSALWMRTFEMVTVVSSEAPAPPPMAAPPLLNAPSSLLTVWVTRSHEPMVPLEMVTVAPAPRPPPMPAPPFLPSAF